MSDNHYTATPLSRAEGELIAVLRRTAVQDVTVTISCDRYGVWKVEALDRFLDLQESTVGEGESFDAAWLAQQPNDGGAHD